MTQTTTTPTEGRTNPRRLRLRTLVLGTLVVAWTIGAGIAPTAVADGTPCADHTDGDTATCTGNCPAGHKIGVTMQLDDAKGGDNVETGDANTTCSNQAASCPVEGGVNSGSCSEESVGVTAAGAPWTCHFEAHDVWWQPDNGFNYNCFSYKPEGGGGSGGGDADVSCNNFQTDLSAGSHLASLMFADFTVAEFATLQHLCALLEGEGYYRLQVVDYANVQMIGIAQGGTSAAIGCDEETGCWPVRPVCEARLDGLSCDVTFDRLV